MKARTFKQIKSDYGLMFFSIQYLPKHNMKISATKNTGLERNIRLESLRKKLISNKRINELRIKIKNRQKIILDQIRREKSIGLQYIDETMKWQRRCRFEMGPSVTPRNFSNSQLAAMKYGERSEALFEKFFSLIFPDSGLYFSVNEHAPFCDAMIRNIGESNPRLIEIKSSFDECIVPMNIKAYYAMKHSVTPENGLIISVLYDEYGNFTGRFYICSMRQVPSKRSDLSDGRIVCHLQYERLVDVSTLL